MNKIDERVSHLLSKMTIREKIGQCIMIEPVFLLNKLNKNNHQYQGLLDPKFLDKILIEYKIGFLFFGGVTSLGDDITEVWAKYIKEVNHYAKEKQIGIPLFFGSDAIHGVNFIKKSTIYSHNLGVVSTWNTDLANRYADMVGKELSAMGINSNFAPTVDVSRDQRWGRVYESLGEDAFLASQFSEALVKGFQDNNQVAACAKHFLGYGESGNGMDRTPADLSVRSILENHLPPFEAAVQSGVKMIMVNGADVNGVPMPASKKYMTDVLRNQLNFKGIVMSDWEDVIRLEERHHVVQSKEEAIMRAFNAGLDLNMAVTDFETIHIMEKLIDENKISMNRLNEAVERILRVKFELGLFDQQEISVEEAVQLCGNDDSQKLAKQLALESMVLLKNENHILPISKTVKSILVTGKTAQTKQNLCGGWTLGWDLANEDDLYFDTFLESLKKKYPNIHVEYAKDVDALKKLNIESFDLIISVVGETPHAEWTGDSADLAIETEEFDLLKSAKQTGLPVVMVSLIARPANMVWADQNIQAILWAYNPGSKGAEAIVDVLFGDYNPSGKLPISFPKDSNQIPVVYNARKYHSQEVYTKYDPLYPFGYGLSYTNFEYSNLVINNQMEGQSEVLVSVDVQNVGQYAGDEVVQLYLEDEYASVTRPLNSLKGFNKIHLEPNHKETVSFVLREKELGLYDENLRFVVESRSIIFKIKHLEKTINLHK